MRVKVTISLLPDERTRLRELAELYTDGNVSALVRRLLEVTDPAASDEEDPRLELVRVRLARERERLEIIRDNRRRFEQARELTREN